VIENVEDLRAELQSQFLSNGELFKGSSCAGLLLKNASRKQDQTEHRSQRGFRPALRKHYFMFVYYQSRVMRSLPHFCFSAPCFDFAKATTISDLNFSSAGFGLFPGFLSRRASMRLRAALSFP